MCDQAMWMGLQAILASPYAYRIYCTTLLLWIKHTNIKCFVATLLATLLGWEKEFSVRKTCSNNLKTVIIN